MGSLFVGIRMINIKKVSQINTIIEEAEKKVKKVKYIQKNEPKSGPTLIIFNEIKNKFLVK